MNKDQIKATIESESLLKQEARIKTSKRDVEVADAKFGKDVVHNKNEPAIEEIKVGVTIKEELQSDLYTESKYQSRQYSQRREEPKEEKLGSFFDAKDKSIESKFKTDVAKFKSTTSKPKTDKFNGETNKSKYSKKEVKSDLKRETLKGEDNKTSQKSHEKAKKAKFDGGSNKRFKTSALSSNDKSDKRFKVSEDELSDIIASKRKSNTKLTEKELRQKAYFANKLQTQSAKYEQISSDDVIVSKTYKRKKVSKKGREKYVSDSISSMKYHVDNYDTNDRNSDDTNIEVTKDLIQTSKYSVDASAMISRGGKKLYGPRGKDNKKPIKSRRFNVVTNTKPRKKNFKEADLILQDKKTTMKFLALKHKKEEIAYDMVKDLSRKIVSKIKEIAVRNKIGVIVAAIFLMMALSAVGSIGVLLQGLSQATGTYLSGLSLSTDFDMTDAENYFTKMEADLQEILDNIEEAYPDYDKYEISFDDEIGHDPLKLMAYLSSVYEGYDLATVKEVLDKLFEDMYVIEIEESTVVENGEELTVFSMTITKTDWDELMSTRIDDSKKDLYDSYEENGGGHQAFHNPFSINWKSKITSEFGWRIHPITGEEKFHSGVDIAMPKGTPVMSCSEGVVVKCATTDVEGNYVVVEDETGYRCSYMHLSEICVSVGDKVDYETLIGKVGSTGRSTGPHLHLQVTDASGQLLNPKFMVQGGY